MALVVTLVGTGLARLHAEAVLDNNPTDDYRPVRDARESGAYAAVSRVASFAGIAVEMDPRFTGLLYADPRPVADEAANGAVGLNADWALGRRRSWYVEEQAQDNTLIGGILTSRPAVAWSGLRALQFGFAHQGADGGFPGVPDAFHSTSYFVESTAYSLLFLREAGKRGVRFPPHLLAQAKRLVEPLHRAARWLGRRDILARGLATDASLTHRRFLVGSALGLAGIVTRDASLRASGRRVVADGLNHQWRNGVLPEDHQYDSSYQAIAICYAERWLAYNQANPLAPAVATAIGRGLSWEQTRIAKNGRVIAAGNSRVNGAERDRAGRIKQIATSYAVRALAYWGVASKRPTLLRDARRVVTYRAQAGPGGLGVTGG